MLSANEIREVINGKDKARLSQVHLELIGKEINRNCGDCIRDAHIALQVYIRELEYQAAPIHLYLINPIEETLLQIEGNPDYSKVMLVQSSKVAFSLFESNAVNIIADNAFFDSTISNVKKIKPYEAYALDCYQWNGNGHAELTDSIGAWVVRGMLKKDVTHLSQLHKGYIVSNPCGEIHAIRC